MLNRYLYAKYYYNFGTLQSTKETCSIKHLVASIRLPSLWGSIQTGWVLAFH
jgi:hypothetical protein